VTAPARQARRRLSVVLLEVLLAVGAAIVLVGAIPGLARLGLGEPGGATPSRSADASAIAGSRAPIMVLMSRMRTAVPATSTPRAVFGRR